MSLILPEDFAESTVYKVVEKSDERYGGMQMENVIPRIFKVRPVSEMNHGHYHQEVLEVRDANGKEREIGEAAQSGSVREQIRVIHKLRFFTRYFEIPREILEYVKRGSDRAMSSLQDWALEQAPLFAEERLEVEQTHAAAFFNKGGYTAGAAEFDNTPKGGLADPGGALLYDGVELFNLTGNTRTATNGTTYYNHAGALALTPTNWETLENLIGDTNGYRENGNRLDTTPKAIVYPQALRTRVDQIMETEGRYGTANRDGNAFAASGRQRGQVLGYDKILWPYLTDADGWFLGSPQKGLVWWQDDSPLKVEFSYDVKSRTDCLLIQSAFGAQVSPGGWRYWGAANTAAS